MVTALWCVLLGGAVLIEIVGRWTTGAGPATRLGERLSSRVLGRIGLVVLWWFVGWHLFARYTLPHT